MGKLRISSGSALGRAGLALGVVGFVAVGFGGTSWVLGKVFGSSRNSAGTTTAPAPRVPASSSPVSVASSAPSAVVQAFCRAINTHDLRHAWADLGGRNMVPSWEKFDAGFADTSTLSCVIGSVRGERVAFRIVASHYDQTTARFDAVYTVENGVITAGTMQAV
ncbi:hypothetical protein [Streptacidiphilus neutrinimicus]|uniref:hypothetical protein n=1 Tax=Streptacidiphilus neutrinimicus TaxID=105420 RepID=UPI000693930D|nr:hypothetical protein [Streptacidiphilus neutrinimicus]